MVLLTVQSQGSGVASTPAGPHSSCIPTLAIAGSSSAGALPGQERCAGREPWQLLHKVSTKSAK